MIGYVGTAGLAVLTIIVYYLVSYNPEKDPFRGKEESNQPLSLTPSKSNPVDIFMLILVIIIVVMYQGIC